MSNEADIRAAQFAIDAMKATAGLETDNGRATDLWHLLRCLLEWSDHHNLDFDAELSDVRDHLARGEA